jgi:hypothetical protein
MDFQIGDCVQHIETKHAWTVRRVAPLVLWDYYRGARRNAKPAHYRLLYRPEPLGGKNGEEKPTKTPTADHFKEAQAHDSNRRGG